MPLELAYDKVVIGSSLEAVLFAYYNKYKLLYCANKQPNQLEVIEDFGLGNNIKKIWDKHVFLLSMAGNIPFENKIKHIRYETSNNIKVISMEEGVYDIKYSHLYIFDDDNVLNLPLSLNKTTDRVRITDWFRALSGQNHNIENVSSEDDFMNEVIFYKNSKKSSSLRKDVCVISYAKESEIDLFPEHLVKIKTQKLMSSRGIIGKNKTSNISLEHIERDILYLGKNIYENFDNVTFMYTSANIIYDSYNTRSKIDYMKYLKIKLDI